MAKNINSIDDEVLNNLVLYPALTHAQCDAVATLAEKMKTHHRLTVLQTHTESGGKHLYILLPSGDEFHIALNGNILKLDTLTEGERRMVKASGKKRVH